MKPGNPPVLIGRKGANSGGLFRKMRGMSNIARPLKYRGFFVPLYSPYLVLAHSPMGIVTIHTHVFT
jgi:hypothetical protein